jgi:hypothetical protein
LAQRPAMHGWSEGRLGHILAARSSRGGGPRRAEMGRALLARAGAVTRSTATRWGLAGSKVLPTSTGGVTGWHLADRVEAGLTLAAPRCEGAERRHRRRGGGRRRGSEGSSEWQGGPAAGAETR